MTKPLLEAAAVVVLLLFSIFPRAAADDAYITVPADARSAIDRALAHLAATQESDGSWQTAGRGDATACMSLAALAFMSDGHQPGRGRYGEVVAKALDFVLESSQESGLLEYGLPHHAMYSHGFSTLLLAEAWGTSDDPRIRDRLKKAVELILSTQNREGGWRYQPRVADADISVTVTQIVALRAAANAGIEVPRDAVERAVSYLKSCARRDGGFSYQPGSGASGFARTGAALVSFILAGKGDAPEVEAALGYLLKNRAKDERYYYYGNYYASQGMHLVGAAQWHEWYSFTARELVLRQRGDGSWHGQGEEKIQSTAMAVLVLTIPNGYLPIYQR